MDADINERRAAISGVRLALAGRRADRSALDLTLDAIFDALSDGGGHRDPLTPEAYLSARMITEPFCLYDCDAPIDGSTVIIVSDLQAAHDLRASLTDMAATDAGRHLWERTDLKPADVDVANLYDGFSLPGDLGRFSIVDSVSVLY